MAESPENDVPDGVLAVLQKALNIDKQRPGKAAAPPDPLVQEGEDAFEHVTVSGVMMEGNLDVEMASNVR